MAGGNKKEAVAALHREQIMKAAEALFIEKGFLQTTIEDISKASEYSRRTIYAYYESKDDILYHIIERGLLSLKSDIEAAISCNADFISQYKAICEAIIKYQRDCPCSLEGVNGVKPSKVELSALSDTVKNIFALGTEINGLLADCVEQGKERGVVRKDVVSMLTVQILWSGISALFSLAKTKGTYICKEFSISEDEFLRYGFRQLINSILEERIPNEKSIGG